MEDEKRPAREKAERERTSEVRAKQAEECSTAVRLAKEGWPGKGYILRRCL